MKTYSWRKFSFALILCVLFSGLFSWKEPDRSSFGTFDERVSLAKVEGASDATGSAAGLLSRAHRDPLQAIWRGTQERRAESLIERGSRQRTRLLSANGMAAEAQNALRRTMGADAHAVLRPPANPTGAVIISYIHRADGKK